jgi:16S rRNA processing protein RimM
MKSVKREDFIIAGVVEKAHGNSGQLKVSVRDKIKIKEWVFLEINRKPVPFFILEKSPNGNHILLRLEGIRSIEQASGHVGRTMLVNRSGQPRTRMQEGAELVGFAIIDKVHGPLGEVNQIEELPGQTLIVTNHMGKELLIPAVEEYILEINHGNRTLLVKLPEGLLEL